MNVFSLPDNIATEAVKDALAEYEFNPHEFGVVVCGSAGEAANDFTLGRIDGYGKSLLERQLILALETIELLINILFLDLKAIAEKKFNRNIYLDWVFSEYKHSVWGNVVLNSEDQLRQRVAWSLYQIIPIGKPDTYAWGHPEFWLLYYDIFVRHAFGNYRDVLREISYSDSMSSWLSFVDNKSVQYHIDADAHVQYPDENYAR